MSRASTSWACWAAAAWALCTARSTASAVDPVALKTMNRVGASTLLRFKHEFRTLLDVAHPNLVTLYELICDGQNWFLTMELLDGVTSCGMSDPRNRRSRPLAVP